ncbi:hypothetical protein RB614_03520 [Phytohabitans sp. ZYX-F-186]|uniref:Uncharacterized protein n=1 Tax=Phytohabitans maris TaxID=3071409 RepID=A0ABU0Z960_9ACTN|nr:hypothetical protein [Phytohabitans sp. ZYX-F-186]MDQ7903582.1 hypothetical protein [Phytohabitans sp. ZYX-F-186]
MRTTIAAAVGLAFALAVPAAAAAIPPGGASADTPGTSASVSPRTLAAGDRISFTVGGFPRGETVNIKIDDGEFCAEAAVHGACVVHAQKIRSDGTASGSFLVPEDLAPGGHWLRFLATEQILDAGGNQQGVKGYTRRGGADFTVVRAGGNAARTTAAAPRPSTAPTSALPATPPSTVAPAPAGSASPTGAPASGVVVTRSAGTGEGGDVALWAILGAALVTAAGGTVGHLIRRRRPPGPG